MKTSAAGDSKPKSQRRDIVAAYLEVRRAHPKASESEIAEFLRESGFRDGDISLLLQLAPVVFGRQLLRNRSVQVEFSDECVVIGKNDRMVLVSFDDIWFYRDLIDSLQDHSDLVSDIGSDSMEVTTIQDMMRRDKTPKRGWPPIFPLVEVDDLALERALALVRENMGVSSSEDTAP